MAMPGRESWNVRRPARPRSTLGGDFVALVMNRRIGSLTEARRPQRRSVRQRPRGVERAAHGRALADWLGRVAVQTGGQAAIELVWTEPSGCTQVAFDAR